jgi:hypothetical protein
MKFTHLVSVLLAAALLAAGCSKSHDHDKKSAHGEHVHVAPHGGTLIEIGDHAYNLELLRDKAAGKLTAWVLDGHAENFVRLPAREIAFVAMPGGTYTPITLKAVGNSATGETVGDTSQFEFQADWLKTAGTFAGIFTVEIKGTVFKDVAFVLDDDAHGSGEKKKKNHGHTSVHGGTLVEIGDHEYNVDLVRDAATGTLRAYVLGAHAKGKDDIVRLAARTFTAEITAAGQKHTLVFQALAHAETGEKPGDTSRFEARADWLKTTAEFDGVFTLLVIDGHTFTATPFNFPQGRTRP